MAQQFIVGQNPAEAVAGLHRLWRTGSAFTVDLLGEKTVVEADADRYAARVVELIETGAIGKVKEVHVWCGRSWGGIDRPADKDPIPEGLHWDLWLGPDADRPYHPDYHPF